MPSSDPDTIVRQFIDGDLSDDEVPEALHRIAEDSDACSLLQFEIQMTQDLATARSARSTPEFTTRTMEQVAEVEASDTSRRSQLRSWWETLTQPLITIPVRPTSAVAVLALVITVSWLAWPSGLPIAPPQEPDQARTNTSMQTTAAMADQQGQTVWTRFVYMTDEANSVAVAGDFSQWEPIPLSPRTANDKTVWTGLVPIQRGEHEYQFVIDGEKWVTDPLAPVKHDDGFGAKNAVLKL